MTHLTLAALVLAAATSAAPETGVAVAPGAKPAAAKAPKGKAKEPAKPTPASKEAIKDAVASLLGPCSPEMAGGTVKGISVIDGKAMNAILEKEKSEQARADPAALFLAVDYTAGDSSGKDYRQISTFHHLTTAQAQVLVGAKMCVFGKAE